MFIINAGWYYLLMVYAKASREDMSPDEKQAATALTDALKKQHPSRED